MRLLDWLKKLKVMLKIISNILNMIVNGIFYLRNYNIRKKMHHMITTELLCMHKSTRSKEVEIIIDDIGTKEKRVAVYCTECNTLIKNKSSRGIIYSNHE